MIVSGFFFVDIAPSQVSHFQSLHIQWESKKMSHSSTEHGADTHEEAQDRAQKGLKVGLERRGVKIVEECGGGWWRPSDKH